MTPAQLRKANLLYGRYQTGTREYRELARQLGLTTTELNSKIWWYRRHPSAPQAARSTGEKR